MTLEVMLDVPMFSNIRSECGEVSMGRRHERRWWWLHAPASTRFARFATESTRGTFSDSRHVGGAERRSTHLDNSSLRY